jgi:hypothetical protein
MAFGNSMQKHTYYFIITGFFSLNIIINFAYVNGEAAQTLFVNNTINKINELEPFYIATSLECLDSKEIKSHPYIVFEDNCIEKATIKGIGKIVNQETFLNTVIENKTVFGQGRGTISTEDGQSSIDWNSYDANLVKGGYPGYRGIIYFNSTSDDKFAFLNNTVGIYESDSDTVRTIWSWE